MEKPTIDLSVIVISYNTRDLTLDCLQSILFNVSDNHELQNTIEILVVDNASTDNSAETIREFQKTSAIPLILIENKSNLGFATANNQAIKKSLGKYILLLNSDTILQPNALPTLLEFAEKSDTTIGLIAAGLQNQDGSYQPQGGWFPSLITLAIQQFFLDDLPLIGRYFPSIQYRYQKTGDVQNQDWVGGAALIIKRSVIEKVGLLDESIFMYAEDIEYCWRAKHLGFDSVILHPAIVTHLGNQSGSSQAAVLGEVKGLLYFFTTYKPAWQVSLAKCILKLGAHLRVLLFGTMLHNQTRADSYRAVLTFLAK